MIVVLVRWSSNDSVVTQLNKTLKKRQMVVFKHLYLIYFVFLTSPLDCTWLCSDWDPGPAKSITVDLDSFYIVRFLGKCAKCGIDEGEV